MKKDLKTYYFWLAILTLSLGFVAFILFRTWLKKYYTPEFWVLLFFFFVVNIVTHTFIVTAEKKNKLKFNTIYLISFTLKFVSYLLFLVIYLVLAKTISFSFAISLFILYVIYTVFEVRSTIIFSKSSEKNFEKSD